MVIARVRPDTVGTGVHSTPRTLATDLAGSGNDDPHRSGPQLQSQASLLAHTDTVLGTPAIANHTFGARAKCSVILSWLWAGQDAPVLYIWCNWKYDVIA